MGYQGVSLGRVVGTTKDEGTVLVWGHWPLSTANKLSVIYNTFVADCILLAKNNVMSLLASI